MKKKSQADRLFDLLEDGEWHSTPDILAAVYGSEHLGIARIASRVADLRRKGFEIESRRDELHGTVWHYRLSAVPEALKPKPKPKMVIKFVEIDGVKYAREVPAEMASQASNT